MDDEKALSQAAPIFTKSDKIVALIANIDQLQYFVDNDEMIFVKSAVERRKREFAAGRNIARLCLKRLNHPHTTIPALESRSPGWPNGIVGSISHSGGVVAAAVGRQSDVRAIGLDIEEYGAVTTDLAGAILTNSEAEMVVAKAEADFGLATFIFCCKEAIYKAVNPITNEFLDFKDVSVEIRSNEFTAFCNKGKNSYELVSKGHGFLESKSGFVRALFVID